MNDDVDLMSLREAVLNCDRLRHLFADLAAFACVADVRLKGGATARSLDGSLTLEQAFTALTIQQSGAVQLRYVYDSQNWCDTITRQSNGYRLVRAPVCVD